MREEWVLKKLGVLITIASAVVLIAGCTQNVAGTSASSSGASRDSAGQSSMQSPKPSSSTADQKTQKDSGTASSVQKPQAESGPISASQGSFGQTLKEVRAALKTQAKIKLPQTIYASGDKSISALTQGTSSGYTVTFKQTARPVKINDRSLSGATTLATMKAVIYSSDAQAQKQISFHQYGASDGQPVSLGYRITGYTSAGAGTAGISWNEGRWTLMALSPTSDLDKGKVLAKKIVAYLDTYLLPAPNRYGMIQVYTDNRQHLVMWQDGRTVYQLTDVTDPMNLVRIAVSVK